MHILVAIAKKRLGVKGSLYTFLQVTGFMIFEKRPIFEVFDNSALLLASEPSANQLDLFEI